MNVMIEQPHTSRMPVCRLLGAALLALFVVQCSAYQIKGQGEQPLILESQGENCRVVQKKGLYSLLFGAVPLNPVEPEDLFPKMPTAKRKAAVFRIGSPTKSRPWMPWSPLSPAGLSR